MGQDADENVIWRHQGWKNLVNAFTKGCCRFNSPAFGALGFTCIPSSRPQVLGFVIQVWVLSSDRVLGYHFSTSPKPSSSHQVYHQATPIAWLFVTAPHVCTSSRAHLTISAVIDRASSCTLLQIYIVLERTKKDVLVMDSRSSSLRRKDSKPSRSDSNREEKQSSIAS